MRFSRSANSRFLNCEYVNFCEGKTLYLNLSLDEPDHYAIASATDFGDKKGLFAYRYQVSRMPASGVIRYGGAEYRFRRIPASARWAGAGGYSLLKPALTPPPYSGRRMNPRLYYSPEILCKAPCIMAAAFIN